MRITVSNSYNSVVDGDAVFSIVGVISQIKSFYCGGFSRKGGEQGDRYYNTYSYNPNNGIFDVPLLLMSVAKIL